MFSASHQNAFRAFLSIFRQFYFFPLPLWEIACVSRLTDLWLSALYRYWRTWELYWKLHNRPHIVSPLDDPYDVFVYWEFFSMSTDLIRCAGRGHLMVDVLWKKFGIWMGQLKVAVIHAPVTQKCWAECNKTMCRFGLDCQMSPSCTPN